MRGDSGDSVRRRDIDKLIRDLAAVRAKMTPVHPAEPPGRSGKAAPQRQPALEREGRAGEIRDPVRHPASRSRLDGDVAVARAGRGFADELRVRTGEDSGGPMRHVRCTSDRRIVAVALALASPARAQSGPRTSTAARPSPSWSASPPAAATTSTRGCWAATSASTSPAIRPWWCRTCRARARMKATQYVYGVAAKDGLTLATVSRGMVTEPLLNARQLRSGQADLARHHHQRDQRSAPPGRPRR